MRFPDLFDGSSFGIHLHAADVTLPNLDHAVLSRWLGAVAKEHGRQLASYTVVFCSDDYLLEMNREKLNHDTYTDIITFDLSEDVNRIEGECYISVERIADNAEQLGLPVEEEQRRVIVHGLLHLCGFDDKGDSASKRMRELENNALGNYANFQ